MEFTRECPKCNKILTYSNKADLKRANKLSNNCKSCSKSGINHPLFGKKISEKTKQAMSKVKRRPIYDIWVDTYGIEGAKKRKILTNKKQSLAALKRKNHLRDEKTLYEIWTDKYGVDEADRREFIRREKLSIAFKGKRTGKNHPNYGKPPAYGAGNGWSGWYKNCFFRSLLELSYLVNVLEQENLLWQTAETKEFAIPYVHYDGTNKKYFPDFLVNGNQLIEIKPKTLHTSPLVLLKKEAAEKYCLEKGWIYKLLEPEKLTNEEIIALYDNKEIKLLPRYEEKFKLKYNRK